jgi:glycosyltransferase involved in cell wall biosynthesis
MTTWKEFSKSAPWVATVQTYNNDWTVYACLQQACKQFDIILVVDDGSNDKTMLEVDRFIRREKPNNLHCFDLSSFDPWPDLKAPKREWMKEVTNKTQSKSKFKAHNIAKQFCPQGLWVSLESDVIVCNDARQRMQKRISEWEDPHNDCEFFNVVMTIDPWHVRSVSDSETEYIKPAGIKHRKEYDHPGDWCLATSWLGGNLKISPDPEFPYGPCFDPWIQKNQIGKKGQDDSLPFGFHMLSYRELESDITYVDRRCLKISEIKDNEVDWDLLHRVRFPVIAKLNNNLKREILSCEF